MESGFGFFGLVQIVLVYLFLQQPSFVSNNNSIGNQTGGQIVLLFFNLFIVLVDLYFVFLMTANLLVLSKKSFLFFIKLLFNIPVVVVAFIFFLKDLSFLFGLFYSPFLYYNVKLYEFLYGISPYSVGVILTVAGAYNLFYLSGYEYIRPKKRI